MFICGIFVAVMLVGFYDSRGPYSKLLMGWLDANLFHVREARNMTRWAHAMGWTFQFSDEVQTAIAGSMVATVVTGVAKFFTTSAAIS